MMQKEEFEFLVQSYIPEQHRSKFLKIFEDAERLQKIRRLMGYVENGTDVTVKFSQDDATKDFFVRAGSKVDGSWYGKTFNEAIDNAEVPED